MNLRLSASICGLILLTTGCKQFGESVEGSLQQLGNDNATVVIPTPYGRAVRANPRSDQTVEITADSVKIIGHTNVTAEPELWKIGTE